MSVTNGRSLAVIEEMKANHFERSLGGLHPARFTIADEADCPLSHPAGSGDGNVNGADRLFFRTTARAGDSCDAHAERAAYLAANALRKCDCHLGADRSFCGNQLRG